LSLLGALRCVLRTWCLSRSIPVESQRCQYVSLRMESVQLRECCSVLRETAFENCSARRRKYIRRIVLPIFAVGRCGSWLSVVGVDGCSEVERICLLAPIFVGSARVICSADPRYMLPPLLYCHAFRVLTSQHTDLEDTLFLLEIGPRVCVQCKSKFSTDL